MGESRTKLALIKTSFWLGIFADALWAVGLFSVPVYRILIGRPEFNPDFQTQLIMAVGGTLMTGWTLLLLWAVRKPIERRMVILLTACPVVLGMLIVALVGYLEGNTSSMWILIKLIVLIVAMTAGYVLACRVAGETTKVNVR